VDGGQHADNQEDRIRREEIEALGFRVLRFWNNEVLSNSGGVLSVIDRELSLRSTRS
jgi:very-short-patch-repair endonuclease